MKLAIGVGVIFEPFLFFRWLKGSPPHPRRCLYTPSVETPAPARPERLRTAGNKADIQNTTHAQTLDTLHRSALDTRPPTPGRSHRRRGWRTGSVSETVQKRTSQNPKNKYAKKRKYLLTITQESV
nr:MAG TPA_asm: hypothetical protein [Caudoviricetes sp.]